MRNFATLDGFLDALGGDVYPEAPCEPHIEITRRTIAQLLDEGAIRAGMRVLDVGCGQGLALRQFRDAGLQGVGITLGSDGDICRAEGFDVRAMDQNFMNFPAGSFDFLWCRHVIEHSVAPFFTLAEYRRVLGPGASLYLEVPSPDTSAHHETNPNHYSVLPFSSWLSLIGRAGFTVIRSVAISVTVPSGPDLYWSFLLRSNG